MAPGKRIRVTVMLTDSPPSKRPCLIVQGDATTASSSPPHGHAAEIQQPPHATNALLRTVPTEIWHQIFQNFVPDPFKPIDQVYSPLRGIELQNPQHEFTDSSHRHRTLLSLSRTCSHLRPIAIPLLYRNILFRHYRLLPQLWRTLAEHPERGQHVQEITCSLDCITALRIKIKLLPILSEMSPVGYASQQNRAILQKLRETLDKRIQPRAFIRCDNDGLFLLPVLAMTPNILSLNIAGVASWQELLIRDPFVRLFMGIDPDGSLKFCRSYLKDLRNLRLEPTGSTPVFPPPFLKDIRFFRGEPSCENNLLLNHIRVLASHECHKLLEATQEMASVLDTSHDDNGNMLPSTSLRRILRSSPAEYVVIRKFLGKVRDLDANPFSWNQTPASTWPFWVDHMLKLELPKDSQGWEGKPQAGGYCGRDFLASLDKAVATSRHSATRLLLQSHAVTDYVRHFLGMTVPPPYAPETHELRLEMDQNQPMRYIRRHCLRSSWDNTCLSDIITSRFSNLCVLRMPLYIHKANRKDIYVDFNPARFRHLQSLTLTVEALWGPVQRVIDMLERTEPFKPKVSNLSMAGEGEGEGSNPISVPEEERIRVLDPWEEKIRAVNRIPPNCRELCLQDWFAEYWKEDGRDNMQLGMDLHFYGPARNEEFTTAVLNGSVQNNYARHRHRTFTAPDSPTPVNVREAIDRIFAVYPQPLEDTVYRYPTTAGDQDWGNPYGSGNDEDDDVPDPDDDRSPVWIYAMTPSTFTRRYIKALFKGLWQMFSHRRRDPFTGELEPPLISQLRPKLRKISFVYTLQSQLPQWDGKRQEAWRLADFLRQSDYLWRAWYHGQTIPGMSEGEGYQDLRHMIMEGSGVDFVLFEDCVGKVPPDPVVTDDGLVLYPVGLEPWPPGSPPSSLVAEASDTEMTGVSEPPSEPSLG
ncbi:hypothetical protein V8F33_009017 [Rhypophila sp. PSN 637]